ncbi:hypothetical protein D3C75_1057980 [compost metagenome]
MHTGVIQQVGGPAFIHGGVAGQTAAGNLLHQPALRRFCHQRIGFIADQRPVGIHQKTQGPAAS